MSRFTTALAATLIHEGLYSNDPNDRGGETICGISRRSFPEWYGWKIVDGILPKPVKSILPKLQEAINDFYEINFWNKIKCDQITDDCIAIELFDCCVNIGQPRAVRILQSALNLLNLNGKRYRDIQEDGSIGTITISLVNDHPDKGFLLKMMKTLRACHYVNLAIHDTTQEVYIKGWLNRVIS